MSRIDTRDGLYWLAAAIGATIVAVLLLHLVDSSEPEPDLPPPTYYQHPEGP